MSTFPGNLVLCRIALGPAIILLIGISVSVLGCDDGFCTGRKNGRYPDPANCDEYYVCHNHCSYLIPCPSGNQFNSKKSECDEPKNVDCDDNKKDDNKKDDIKQDEAGGEGETNGKVNPKNATKTTKCPRIVCYLTRRIKPKDIDPSKCTHMIYAYAKLKGNRLAPKWTTSMGNYRKVTNLKKEYPHLKVLLAVGGWNMASTSFTEMVATQSSRKEFVDTSITFLRDIGFDGLFLDWEYPANRGSPSGDKARFSNLLRELRAAYIREASKTGHPRLFLTAAVAAYKSVIDSAYDVPVLNSELDFMNLMTYSLHGYWDKTTGHNSPLYAGSWEKGAYTRLNVKWVANYWVKKGASREKLVIGMPFYGRTFSLVSSSKNGVGASAHGAGIAGPSTRRAGMLAYFEICQMMNKGASKKWIDEQEVPYLVSGDQWVGYDDPDSLKNKATFSREEGYGGVMAWKLSHDDIHGRFCSKGKYPLLSALNEGCN